MTSRRNDLRDIVFPFVFALGVAGCGVYAMLFAVLYDTPCHMGSASACATLDFYGGGGAAALFSGLAVALVLAVAPFVKWVVDRLRSVSFCVRRLR